MTDLYTLTIAFRQPGSSLRLVYEGQKAASEAYNALKIPVLTPEEEARGLPQPEYSPEVEITDTYGVTASIDRTAVMARWITHCGSEAEGGKAMQTLAAHAQASLQRKLAADPMLKGVAPTQPQFRMPPN